jgi:hypothetical protein
MKVLSQARPIRIAYFVEENRDSSKVLDAIFQSSRGLWGGRFHIIVPVVDGRPLQSFMPWLKAYDPDLIYAYCDIEDEIFSSIHETIAPSYFIRHYTHKDSADTHRDFRPRHKYALLSIETVLPYATLPIRYRSEDRISILDAYYGEARNDPFVQQNFGQFTGSAGHSYPTYLSEFGNALHLLGDSELQPRARYGLQQLETIPSLEAVVSKLSRGELITVSHLSTFATPRLEFPARGWEAAFNIIVGDTFVDRVTFWNARSLFPRWRDGQFVDLIIPSQLLDNGEVILAIGKFIRERNQVSWNQNNGGKDAVVRSSSIEPERLREVAKTLQGDSQWVKYQTKAITSIDDYVPTDVELRRAYFLYADGIGAAVQQNWEENEVSGPQINIRAPRPEHLKYAPPALLTSHSGSWAVELDIPRQNDLSKYQNRSHSWLLPKRFRITRAFRQGYMMGTHGPIAMPRASATGRLCLFADANTNIADVSVPTDEAVFRTGYTSGRDWWPFEDKHDGTSQMPPQLAYEVRRSANGRYFWGVLDMFGGLQAIRNDLLHGFWRRQFEVLGASPARTEARKDAVIERLKKRFRSDLARPVGQSLEEIADQVLEEAEQQRTRPPVISWTNIQSAHEKFIEAYLKLYPPRPDEDSISEWLDRDRATLEPSIQRLCQRGVLHQGYETKCRKCLHRSWISIESLSKTIFCEVCRTASPAPAGRPWAFRLNEFFREALRAHGILPLFWALEKSRDMNEQSFYFEGPLDIFYSEESAEAEQADTDIDLTTVSNGKLQIFEVKHSARQMAKAVRFAEVARRIKPDIATIAVMSPKTPSIESKFSDFENALKGSGIEARLMTLDDRDFSDSSSLAETYSVRVF